MSTLRAMIYKNRTNQDGESVVYIRYNYNESSVYFTTGVKVEPRYFSSKNQQQPIIKGCAGYTSMNKKIRDLKVEIYSIIDATKHEKLTPEPWLVKQRYDQRAIQEQPRTVDFYKLFDVWIQENTLVKAKNTIKGYKVTLGILKKFSINLKTDSISLTTYNKLVKWMVKKDYSNNYIGTIIKRLKVFLRYARQSGYQIHPDLDHKDFKVITEKPIIVYYTQQEFELIRSAKLVAGSQLDKIRDLTVIGCRTGLRISDLSRLSREHFVNGFIQIRAFKNKRDLAIPITSEVQSVIDKWEYNLPKMADQAYNRGVKVLAEKSKVNGLVEQVTYKGGSKQFISVPKCEIVSSHTCVKTFITHCGEKGISAKTVSEITGKTVKVILHHYYGTDRSTIKSEMERAFG